MSVSTQPMLTLYFFTITLIVSQQMFSYGPSYKVEGGRTKKVCRPAQLYVCYTKEMEAFSNREQHE